MLLSSSIADVYEAGAYEDYGCVLEIWLDKRTRCRYRPDLQRPHQSIAGSASLELTAADRRMLDAVRIDSGQLWYVWAQGRIALVRRLDYCEAVPLLCHELDEAGPMASFDGRVHDYACIWWDSAQDNARLSVLAYRQQLERVLRRCVGRKRSQAGSRKDAALQSRERTLQA